ncbi:ATP-binding protein [Streptacidiphilus rugosus]|uniref:ATP-binding protein n=1 Tax=Streptacidiphilus rugosus TaxID=405783 RepID=UPI00055F7A7B|nr:ATP-binding protein [Streptacidiphilus rugosus]
MTGRLGDQLARRRDQRFAGRQAQCGAFQELLQRSTGAVVHLHGPGGIGKSVLLHRFAALGAAAGRTVVWLAPDRPGPEPLPTGKGQLLLLDVGRPGVTDAAALCERLLPTLPDDTLLVLADRELPPLAWRVDPAWQGLLHSMPLGPLDREDSHELLRLRQVPAAEHDRILEAAGGHPLALALAADLWHQSGSGPTQLTGSPRVVHELLARLLEHVPTPGHRLALEASSQVLVTTEPLLAHLLQVPDAREVFDWLRELSAMHAGRLGLAPHDLVRRALDAELRWRDPDRHRELGRRAAGYYQQFFDRGDLARQQAVLSDFAFLHRDNPAVATLLAPLPDGVASGGALAAPWLERLAVRPATAADQSQLRAMTRRQEGPESAELLRAWCARPGTEVLVVAEPGGRIEGFCAALTLDAAFDGTGLPPDAAAPSDPAVTAARAWLCDPDGGDLRPGEHALLVRHWMSRDRYQAPSPVQLLITLTLTHRSLVRNRPALTLLAFSDPESWQPGCGYADFVRLPQADFTTDAHRFGVFVHDWRRTPPLTWLSLLTARQEADDPGSVTAPEAPPATRLLSHEDFAAAVRLALRGLGRAGGLSDTPLLHSRLLADHVGGAADDPAQDADALRTVLLDAAGRLRASPLDRNAYRALHHTYLQPAPSQQRAAEILALPMSTYRRHLAKGVERLTELLWQQETAQPARS